MYSDIVQGILEAEKTIAIEMESLKKQLEEEKEKMLSSLKLSVAKLGKSGSRISHYINFEVSTCFTCEYYQHVTT